MTRYLNITRDVFALRENLRPMASASRRLASGISLFSERAIASDLWLLRYHLKFEFELSQA